MNFHSIADYLIKTVITKYYHHVINEVAILIMKYKLLISSSVTSKSYNSFSNITDSFWLIFLLFVYNISKLYENYFAWINSMHYAQW